MQYVIDASLQELASSQGEHNGYGFAQVPLAVKKKWQETIHTYLADRENLRVLVLLMDDKFKKGKVASTVLSVEKQLKEVPGQFAVEPFSSENYTGVDAMRQQLDEWVSAY